MNIQKSIYLFNCLKMVFKTDFLHSLLILLLNLVLALVPTLQTLAIAEFINCVHMKNTDLMNDLHIRIILILMVVLMACAWVGKSVLELFEKRLEMKLDSMLKPSFIEKISRLEYSIMEDAEHRDRINRVNENFSGNIRNTYCSMLTLLALIIKVLGILIIMFAQVWWAALIILFVSIPCFYISIKAGKEQYDADVKLTKAKRINDYYNEILKNREYVDERTLFKYQSFFIKRFIKKYEETRVLKTKVKLKWYIRMKLGGMATIVVSAVMIAVLVPSVINGKLSVGLFMALVNSIFNIVQNMSWELAWAIDTNTWFNEYFKDMNEIWEMKEDDDLFINKKRVDSFQYIEFKNVSFKYPGTEKFVLNNLSFKICKDKKYAFVGSNGAGKSTIIKLINGLYKEYEGQILLNGKDIREFDRDFLANIFQDFAKYPISIRDNIAIACRDTVSKEQIEQVIEEVELSSFINKVDKGIDTVLGKGKKDSIDISGGEWQKIALARCALSSADVKILDEPTSAMDPIYESMIYNKFKDISYDKTMVLVSHRLASVKMSDVIFVLENGTIVEKGNHNDLIKQGGLYEKMYKKQAKWYEKTV